MKWGEFDLQLISDGRIWLDGGAMFGVVPKTLWQKKTVPDERNRIPLALNCLLVQTGQTKILIDTGCGFKYTDKQKQIYRIEHPTDILQELERFDVTPEQIDFVINTHYHFDHCGGNTRVEGDTIVPTFPNAAYLVRREEYEDASQPNERTAATYFSHNWKPLEEQGQLCLVDDNTEPVPGVHLVHTPGHTPGHQSIKLQSPEGSFFYLADLCPTSAHISLPWIMGYDLYPMTTLEVRRKIYREATRNNWLLFFEHDLEVTLGYLRHENERYFLETISWPE